MLKKLFELWPRLSRRAFIEKLTLLTVGTAPVVKACAPDDVVPLQTQDGPNSTVDAGGDMDAGVVDSQVADLGIDSAPIDQGADTLLRDSTVDQGSGDSTLDGIPADQTVDQNSMDTTVDQGPADSTIDQNLVIKDSTVDQPPADISVDQFPVDGTVDQPPADLNVDIHPPDLNVDTTDDTLMADGTVDTMSIDGTVDATGDLPPSDTSVDQGVVDATVDGAVASPATVYKVDNGDCFQNIAKLFQLMGGIGQFIDATDTVIIKGNAQWPYQGYTHTGCIKAVVDEILAIPGFSGEVHICDCTQAYGFPSALAFHMPSWGRSHNWPDKNWNELAADYQAAGKSVSSKRWYPGTLDLTSPLTSTPASDGWVRQYFSFKGLPNEVYLSYPVFESPLTAGRFIDPKNGVWQGGGYTGAKVKTIVMPSLNNHAELHETSGDYAGVTSAIKSFFGATEITGGMSNLVNGRMNIHGATFGQNRADWAGELVAKYINDFFAPVLYVTAAMWSGWESRTDQAAETKTVLACTNPATLDYVACKQVLWPSHPAYTFLDPDLNNNTRNQILGCISGGIGTIDPAKITVVSATI
jgi:hypothetical protein